MELEEGFVQAHRIFGAGGSVLEPVLVELASLALHILDHSQHLRTFAAVPSAFCNSDDARDTSSGQDHISHTTSLQQSQQAKLVR